MNKLIFFFFLSITCFFSLSRSVSAQQVERQVAISAYIYNFAKNVEWQNEAGLKEFSILIIGEDEKIIKEMRNMAKSKTIREKPIKISNTAAVTNIENVQLIFLLKGKEESLVKVFDQIEGRNILLVTDGYRDKKLIMINFFDSGKGSLQFEINKANILNQQLRIMHDMILLGGTEIDVATLYREGQQSLRSLQKHSGDLEKKMRELETELKQLEKTISFRNKELQDSKDSLKLQSLKIREQQKILNSQSSELAQRKKELADQILEIQEQQKIFALQTRNIETQKKELEKGNKELLDQKKEINQQNDEISLQSQILEEQGLRLHKQRNLVYMLVIIILLVFVLAFSIYKGYENKQKLNKDLEKRVAERTYDLYTSNEQLMVELSERKLAETKLVESENKYRTLLENIPQKIFFKNNELVFVSGNENFASELNITAAEIKGKTDFDFFPKELAEKYRKEDFDFLESGKPMETEERSIRNGQTVWTQIVKIPVKDESGKIIGVQGIFWDITERKRNEEELGNYRLQLEEKVRERTAELEIAKLKAESADQLKSAFLATMSHELRTPLNSIIGFTGMLIQELPGPLNDEQKKQLRMTQKSGRHLLSLINDILDLSKIEAGQLNLSKDKFKISDVIQNVLDLSRPFAQSKNLLLTATVDHELPEIVSDQFRVQQVVINLVNNALKFTEVGTVKVEAFRRNNYLVVKVIDTGLGIEADQIKNLFRPFIQIDSGVARKHEGTGLGLSISKKLITMLSGTISVESEPEKGSTFIIELPLKPLSEDNTSLENNIQINT